MRRCVAVTMGLGVWLGCAAIVSGAAGLPAGPWIADVPQSTAGSVFRECEGCPIMVVIGAGTFTMGSPAGEPGHHKTESPLTVVSIPAPFAVGKFEVTVYQFADFVRETGYRATAGCRTPELEDDAASGNETRPRAGRSWQQPGFYQTGSQPVVCVSFDEARAYVAWLAAKTGARYRLLSEAEWEYAARAGTGGRFHFGEDEEQLCTYANFADRTAPFPWRSLLCRDEVGDRTSEAGRFGENGFGLHDMHGNAAEWVEDCWAESHVGAAADGAARVGSGCEARVIRGGSWTEAPVDQRSAVRRPGDARALRDNRIGFRVARTLE